MTRIFVAVLLLAAAIPSASFAHGPNGAIAECNNGWYVFLDTGSRTCLDGGGVRRWFVAKSSPTDAVVSKPVVPSVSVTPTSNAPIGAVAQCANGWYVFQYTAARTCRDGGGVARWISQSPSLGGIAAVQIDTSRHNGAIARCANGLYIFQRSGSCAAAGGISEWYGDNAAELESATVQVGTTSVGVTVRPFWSSPPARPRPTETLTAGFDLAQRAGWVSTRPYRYRERGSDSVFGYTLPAYPSIEFPQSGSTYDWRSGNWYHWTREPGGDTNVRGLNVNTGSIWHTTINPDGSMRGTDKNFNLWRYDANTEVYINFGTGEMCTGEGLSRVCTGRSKR